MTIRNRTHSRIKVRLSCFLVKWLVQQPKPRGSVYCGEVGARSQRASDTTVGVDVAYVSAKAVAQQSGETTLIEGAPVLAPVLAVEILSPSDTQEDINEKIDDYLSAGVPLVWIIDPHHRTVKIFRPGEEPALVNIRQELSGEPHLPGFRVAASQLFA